MVDRAVGVDGDTRRADALSAARSLHVDLPAHSTVGLEREQPALAVVGQAAAAPAEAEDVDPPVRADSDILRVGEEYARLAAGDGPDDLVGQVAGGVAAGVIGDVAGLAEVEDAIAADARIEGVARIVWGTRGTDEKRG